MRMWKKTYSILIQIICICFILGRVWGAEGWPDYDTSTDEMLKLILTEDYNVRNDAVNLLARRDDPAVVPKLTRMITKSKDPRTRLFAAEVLSKMPSRPVAPELLKVFAEPEIKAPCHLVAHILGRSGDRRVIPELAKYLDHPNWRKRCQAAWALGLLKDRRGLRTLIQIYRSTGNKLEHTTGQLARRELIDGRKCADGLMGEVGDKRAFSILKEAIRDDYLDEEAAAAFGKLGDKRAVPILIEAQKNKYIDMNWIGYGLVLLEEETGWEILVNQLRDKRWGRRRHAIEYMETLTDKRAVPHLISVLQNDTHANVRASAARALGTIGDAAALPALTDVLTDEEQTEWGPLEKVRDAAAYAIHKIKREIRRRKQVKVISSGNSGLN